MSAETKWTPGPWEVSQFGDNRVDESGTGDGLAFVQSTEKSKQVDWANAHLIAAAPELYEALDAMVAYGREHGHGLRIADEALAKARGEA